MKDLLGNLGPSRNVARRMHELEADLRQARTQLRRHNKSPETLGRWGLDTPAPAQQEEGWFITYLDMMTLLLVVMIVMLAFSGSLGEKRDSAQENTAASVTVPESSATLLENGGSVSENVVAAAQTDELPLAPLPPDAAVPADDMAQAGTSADPAIATPGVGLLPGGIGLLPGQSALGDAPLISQALPNGMSISSGPLPSDAGIIPGKLAAQSLSELYPGWGAADLSSSFMGPPRPGTSPKASVLAASPSDTSHAPTAMQADIAMEAGLPPAAAGSVAAAVGIEAAAAQDLPSEGESLAAGMALAELGNDVEVVVNERSVSFRVNSEILFDTSQADLSRPGLSVLRRIVAVLADTTHDITVEGHTDSVPVRRNVRYPSNWELSSSRAGSVVRYLQANGINKSRLKAIGYADTRPIADNNTPDGRASNRRVELIIEKHD